MDNASKNASEMIGSLQMQYNRGRQAAITNELVDIITGLWLSSQSVPGITDTRPRCQRFVISENSLESGIDSVARCYPVISRFHNSLIIVWAFSVQDVLPTSKSPSFPSSLRGSSLRRFRVVSQSLVDVSWLLENETPIL